MIVTLACCGSIFAQHPDSHWPGFHYNDFQIQAPLYASIMINGEPVTTETANWDVMEVAAFVGDEMRMTGMFLTDEYLEYGELFPTLNAEPIYYNIETPGEDLSFKMYNHETGDLYTVCEAFIWDGDGDVITLHTGEAHWEGFDDPDHPLMLNFLPESYYIDITPYSDVDSNGNYYLIASPIGTVQAKNVTNLRSNNFDFYSFDQAQELEWINHRDNENYELAPGMGYLYANSGVTGSTDPVRITFVGSAYAETEVLVELENTDANPDVNMRGWNLLGNPFAVDAVTNQAFYKMDGDVLMATPTEAGATIPAMNGIFVQATDEITSVTFTPATETGGKGSMLSLNLSNGSKVIDRAFVCFGQGSTLAKFQLNRNSSKVYIPVDGQDYAIVRSEEMGEMPVSFKAESNGTYTLSFASQNADFSYLHLIDNLTGADQDLLANPSYSFEARTTDYASRFRLVFATGNDDENFAFFSNGSLVVNNEGNATLQVVDVTGRIIKCENINGCASVNIDAASGVYMVRLVNGDNVKVQKVVK